MRTNIHMNEVTLAGFSFKTILKIAAVKIIEFKIGEHLQVE
jgi:hypothetical protein